MTDPAVEATPGAAGGAAPYGIAGMVVPPGLSPLDVADVFWLLPEAVGDLPLRDVLTTGESATAVFVDDTYPEAPRFGMAVASRVEPEDDAAALLTRLVQERWGDPADHDVSAAGDGANGEPAYREFSRTFGQAQFLLPFRRVYFLLWYRAGDEYAFTVIGDTPAVRAALAGEVAEAFAAEDPPE